MHNCMQPTLLNYRAKQIATSVVDAVNRALAQADHENKYPFRSLQHKRSVR